MSNCYTCKYYLKPNKKSKNELEHYPVCTKIGEDLDNRSAYIIVIIPDLIKNCFEYERK